MSRRRLPQDYTLCHRCRQIIIGRDEREGAVEVPGRLGWLHAVCPEPLPDDAFNPRLRDHFDVSRIAETTAAAVASMARRGTLEYTAVVECPQHSGAPARFYLFDRRQAEAARTYMENRRLKRSAVQSRLRVAV